MFPDDPNLNTKSLFPTVKGELNKTGEHFKTKKLF